MTVLELAGGCGSAQWWGGAAPQNSDDPVPAGLVSPPGIINPTLFPSIPAEREAEMRTHIPQESIHAMEDRQARFVCNEDFQSIAVLLLLSGYGRCGSLAKQSLQGSQRTWGFLSCSPTTIWFSGAGRVETGWQQQFIAFLPRAPVFPWVSSMKMNLLFIPISWQRTSHHSTYMHLKQHIQTIKK